jgi:CBS-domain-containing membrane protein
MVQESDTLAHVMELLSTKRGVHRVNVFNAAGKLTNIITQSSLIEFLAHNLSKLGSVIEKTVDELKLGSSPVVVVDTSSTTSEAFNTLRLHSISAVPVVNQLAGPGIIANIRYVEWLNATFITRKHSRFQRLVECNECACANHLC